jgi:hypothetical protein
MSQQQLLHKGLDDWLPQKLTSWGIASLTDVQENAISAGAASGTSLIVSAPTSSGKTLIAEIAASDVTRLDGARVVDTIFLAPEVLIPGPGETDGNPNEGWFLTTNYPHFVSVVSSKGSGQVFTSGLMVMRMRPMWRTAPT